MIKRIKPSLLRANNTKDNKDARTGMTSTIHNSPQVLLFVLLWISMPIAWYWYIRILLVRFCGRNLLEICVNSYDILLWHIIIQTRSRIMESTIYRRETQWIPFSTEYWVFWNHNQSWLQRNIMEPYAVTRTWYVDYDKIVYVHLASTMTMNIMMDLCLFHDHENNKTTMKVYCFPFHLHRTRKTALVLLWS